MDPESFQQDPIYGTYSNLEVHHADSGIEVATSSLPERAVGKDEKQVFPNDQSE